MHCGEVWNPVLRVLCHLGGSKWEAWFLPESACVTAARAGVYRHGELLDLEIRPAMPGPPIATQPRVTDELMAARTSTISHEFVSGRIHVWLRPDEVWFRREVT